MFTESLCFYLYSPRGFLLSSLDEARTSIFAERDSSYVLKKSAL